MWILSQMNVAQRLSKATPDVSMRYLLSSSIASPVQYHVPAIVIGAGVVGLAVARAIALQQKEVLLLDRANYIGSETSSRNSEVIHAGLYYPPNSWKARWCVEGKELLYQYLRDREGSIPYKNCGKLVVATLADDQMATLQHLYQQGHANGVDDLQLLSPDDVQVMEPDIVAKGGALWSPSTGVLDSHSFLQSLLSDAQDSGNLTLALRSNVIAGGLEESIVVTPISATKETGHARRSRIRVRVQQVESDGMRERAHNVDQDEDLMDISCDTLVNCAGLWASQVASHFHHNDKSDERSYQPPSTYFAKGNYFRLVHGHGGGGGGAPTFRHLIYPVPVSGGLGIHATLDWSDNNSDVKFGPDVEWEDPNITNPDQIANWTPNASRDMLFEDAIRHYWPNVSKKASSSTDGGDSSSSPVLTPDFAGWRPKLRHPSIHGKDSLWFDFTVHGPSVHGVDRLYHLFGIESPGLTSSLAIGKYIAEQVQRDDAKHKA